MNRNPRVRGLVVLACLPLLLAVPAGCADQVPDLKSSPAGANVTSDTIQVLNVLLDPPPDGDSYHVNDSAVLRFALANLSGEADTLKSIQVGNAATEARLNWDSDCSGTAEPVSQVPVLAHDSVPLPPGTGPVQGSVYYATLEGITKEIRAGTSVPLVFRFEKAGLVPADAPVLVPGAAVLPPLGCHRG